MDKVGAFVNQKAGKELLSQSDPEQSRGAVFFLNGEEKTHLP